MGRMGTVRKREGRGAVFRGFFRLLVAGWTLSVFFVSSWGGASPDFRVYSVYHPLDLGETRVAPEKEYYVSMGQAQGLKSGDFLEISRRLPTYDLQEQRFYRDLLIPIALLEVIHVEPHASVAHLKKMLRGPQVGVQAVMVGDQVRRVEASSVQ